MAFKIMGVQSLVVMTLLIIVIKAPPEGYKPEGWEPKEEVVGAKTKHISLGEKSQKDLIKDPLFYLLVIAFACGVTAGSMMVAHASPIAQFQVGVTEATAVVIVSYFFLFNGAGRLLWGFISDRIGRYYTIMAIFIVNGGADKNLDLK